MYLRAILREIPAARATYIRAKMLFKPKVRHGGVLYLVYHGVEAADRESFTRQLQSLREAADFIGMTDSLEALRRPPGSDRYVCLSFDDGRRDAFDHALPILAAQDVPATFFVVADWINAGWESALSWADLAAMTEAGMEIGSHSVTHRRLAHLDAVAVGEEMASSRVQIEDAVGLRCDHFAAPFGLPGQDYLPDRDPALARTIGYRSFFTTIPRGAKHGDDAFALPRVRMEPGWGQAELRYALQR